LLEAGDRLIVLGESNCHRTVRGDEKIRFFSNVGIGKEAPLTFIGNRKTKGSSNDKMPHEF
jgi:hypothetical protein